MKIDLKPRWVPFLRRRSELSPRAPRVSREQDPVSSFEFLDTVPHLNYFANSFEASVRR